MKPLWNLFWQEYPDYITYPIGIEVKKDIGGELTQAWLGRNTCAMRLSRGLNYSGAPVPRNFTGMNTVAGGDKLRYAYRVREMRLWLPTVLGAPDYDLKKSPTASFNKATLAGMSGIIAFDVSFSDATGHLDAWDGSVFSHEYEAADYWDRASRITLWALP